MKVYVDKLPVDCGECPCRDVEYNICQLKTPAPSRIHVWDYEGSGKRPDNCPLILIEPWRLESCKTCGAAWNECEVDGYTINKDTYTCHNWEPK